MNICPYCGLPKERLSYQSELEKYSSSANVYKPPFEPSKSYPYLSIARHYGMNYNDVLYLSQWYSPKMLLEILKISYARPVHSYRGDGKLK